MKIVDPLIQNIVDRLKLAEEIYEKAAQSVHNQPMRDQFDTLAKQKTKYITEIAEYFNIDRQRYQINLTDRIRVELDKVGIEFDNLVIHRNEMDILSYCISREEEVVGAYKKFVDDIGKDQHLIQMIQAQMNESMRNLFELKETQKVYDFERTDK